MKNESMQLPVVGERYRCESCGMQIQIETDCHCDAGEPTFECCGSSLSKC